MVDFEQRLPQSPPKNDLPVIFSFTGWSFRGNIWPMHNAPTKLSKPREAGFFEDVFGDGWHCVTFFYSAFGFSLVGYLRALLTV